MELKEKLSNLIEEIYSINSDIESIKNSSYIEIKSLQRENKELKAKVAYLELNKEGIEQKDDILFKQNEDLKEKIAYLRKKILNYEYGKNSIDREEKKDLMQEIKELEQELKISNKARKQLRTELTRSNRKNKYLEDKFKRICKTIEQNYYQDGYYELLRIKNIIAEILKES